MKIPKLIKNNYKIKNKNKMKHYFFNLDKRGVVRPISGQLKGTEPINDKLYVSCPKSVRDKSIPTYFSDDIKLAKSGKTYLVSGFRALTDEFPEIKKEYEVYIGKGEVVKSTTENTILYKITEDPSLKAPTSELDGFFMSPDNWSVLMRNVLKHTNTLILGPAGCGKTSCIKVLCNKLGLNLSIFDMGSMIDPISSLLGVHRLEKGESIFDYAKFTRAIQEPGVILLDELSRAPQSAMNILLPCLDDRRSLSIEIACGKGIREIKVNPDVTFIATANIGVEYTGTNTMDRALVSRFFALELGNIPDSEEVSVLKKRTGISDESSTLIVRIANTLRSLFVKSEISVCPSIRETLAVAEMVSDGWTLLSAMQSVYLPLYQGSVQEGERCTVFKTLTSF